MNILTRIKTSPRELLLFATAALALGMGFSMIDSTFNNFLEFKFQLTGFQRSFLEFPRELPGFLVVFVSAALWFLCSRRLGVVAMLLGAVGSLLLGFASTSYGMMVPWLFILSLGQHLYMPIASTIGMELAQEGQDGRRLGTAQRHPQLCGHHRQFHRLSWGSNISDSLFSTPLPWLLFS